MILIRNRQVFFEDVDISRQLIAYLFEEVQFEGPFLLGDLFHLLELNPSLDPIFERFNIHDLKREALRGPSPQARLAKLRRPSPQPDDLDFLELFETLDIHRRDQKIFGSTFLQLHGIGLPLTEDHPHYGPKGTTTSFSVSLTPLADLLLIPLQIRSRVDLIEHDPASLHYLQSVSSYSKSHWTLSAIFEGILSELSFYGDSDSRDATFDSILNSLESITQSGDSYSQESTLDLENFDDFFDFLNLHSEYFDLMFEWNPSRNLSHCQSCLLEFKDWFIQYFSCVDDHAPIDFDARKIWHCSMIPSFETFLSAQEPHLQPLFEDLFHCLLEDLQSDSSFRIRSDSFSPCHQAIDLRARCYHAPSNSNIP